MKKSQLVNLFSVVFLLLIFSAFSSSAWGAPTHACGGIHTWHDGNKDYYLEDHKCDFFGSESINNKDLGTITSSSFGIDFVIYNNDGNNTYNNGLVGYQIDDAAGEWPTLTLERNGGYGYNGTNYAKYKVYLNISALNLSNGQHTIKFYYRVPHVNNDWYINNSNNNYSFTFTLAGESSEDEDIDVPEMPDGLVCDSYYRKVLFFEDFGVLEKETSRKQNNTVDEKEFVTSYNFVAECKSIKNAGDYAIITNPTWSGCTATSNNSDYGDPCFCKDEEGVRLWYKNCLDHTEGDGNLGGMLQFDCRDGNSKDVLYQRTLKNVCKNTFLNFSAYIKKANTSEADPIKARFILRRGGADGEPIGKKDIDNINLNDDNINLDDGWLQISAMFNTGDLNDDGEITVQLINLAKYGQNGNDILLDDLELSACLPLAKLVCSDGVSVEKTIDFGETEVLTAFIENGILENPYYYWQYKTARSLWQPFFDEANQTALAPTQGLDKMQVKPEESSVQYRVIIANSAKEAMSIASEREFSDDCSIGAITNEVTITTIKNNLELDASITDGDICVDGVDATTLTLTVKNPRLVDVTDVEVKLSNITNLNITKESGTGTYSSGKWSVRDIIPAGESVSIVLNITSNTSVSAVTSKVIQSFVRSVDGTVTYDSYSNAPTESKAQSTLKLKPLPAKPTFVSDKFYKECALTGSNTNVYFNTLIKGDELKVFSNEGLTTTVEFFNGATPITKQVYYANQTYEGCTGDTVQFPVTVLELPKLVSAKIEDDKTSICGSQADSKATLLYEFEGGLKPYTLYVERTPDGEATKKINIGELEETGKKELKPTVKTTYRFIKVEDANGCYSESSTGLVNDITINVVNLEIVKGLGDSTVCADKRLEYSIITKGEELHYQWYESTDNGVNKSKVGEDKNTYTTDVFEMTDKGENQKQYYVEVYQDSKVCPAKESKSKVIVQDCSKLSLASNITSDISSVCIGGEITLNYTITNNDELEEAKGVVVTITGLSEQELKTPITGYDHSTGTWEVGTLAANGGKAKLSITIIGKKIVKSDKITAYISKSGTTEYEEKDAIKAINYITVMKYTDKPTLIPETYKGCPVDDMLNLESQIATPTDKKTLKFYTDESLSITETQANKNTVGTTTYYVRNQLEGECPSDTTTLKIVVFPQPTATLSGTTTICKNSSTDLKIELTGTRKYKIIYEADVNGIKSETEIEEEVNSDEISIPVTPDKTTKYTLKEVKDGNECLATISGGATVTVNNVPTIKIGTDAVLPAEICLGTPYKLPNVTVNTDGYEVTESGWYLVPSDGNGEITLDSENRYTFKIEDKGKSLVYKAKNQCDWNTAEFVPSLNIVNCADFTIVYSLDKKEVCKDEEVVLTATITNNSNVDLSNVILSQSWIGEQIASKDANNNVKEIFVTSGDVPSAYNKDNHLWTIETFTAHKSATLTITFSAQKSEVFDMYMTESNTVKYENDAENPVNVIPQSLKVKEISDPVEVRNPYNGVCPTEESKTVKLSDLVTSDKTSLTFFDKDKNKLTEEPTFDSSKKLAAVTYYITNQESEKCESKNPTEVNLEIFNPISASISTTTTSICSGTSSDVNITVVGGTPDFTIVYNNGVDNITDTISETSKNITESLTSDRTYKLISVTDSKTCSAYLKGTELVTVTVNPRPELVSFEIEDSDDIICEGTSTNLKANFKGTPDFTFTLQTTKAVDGVTKTETTDYTTNDSEWSMQISEAGQYKITKLSDEYCESETLTDAELTLIVEELPELTLSATDVTLNCTSSTATITASGAYKYEWSYLDQTGATQTKSGSTLALQQTDSEVSSLVTEYTVYGYSENANCQSVEAKTVKVTEDFVKPVASIKVSERTDGTIQEWLDCNQETIKLEADITLNTVTIDKYIWSDGSDADNTIINKADTYTLQVVGKNGCISEVATKTIAENIIKPQVSIDSYVKDPITGEIATQTKLTCTNKEITLDGKINNADEYSENYPNGEFTYLWSDGATTSSTVARTPLASSPMEYILIVTAPNGCDNSTDKAKVTITEDVTQPVLDIKEVYELCPSDTLTKTTLSSLLPKTSGVTYKFYDESGDEIEDLYDASSAITEYYVVGVSENGCESEKVSFAVDLAKNVDFTLTASQTSMLVGGNETVITIIPNAESDEADTYIWQANGNEIAVDGLEYSTNLYLDTKFEVTATNRCDSKSQEVSIEVLWPTAFTPHNDNGKNDDFAKGMPIIVFNRFYTKIFEGPDGWDGTINGTMNDSKNIAVPGVYYYKVDLPNGEVKKGTIEIVR